MGFLFSLTHKQASNYQSIKIMMTVSQQIAIKNDNLLYMNKNKVLIISDDSLLRLQLRSLLEQEYHVIEATNKLESLTVSTKSLPNLILLDNTLPEINSFTCLKELRQLDCCSQTPILILTNFEDELSVEQAFEVGADDCINKPIHRAVLLGRVSRLLKTNQTKAELGEKQYQREQLIWRITERVRQFGGLEEIFNTTVSEVQQFLECDRVLFYRVFPDGHGKVVASAVVPGCPSLLDVDIDDPCFRVNYLKLYRQGRVRAIDDMESAILDPCYVKLIQPFQVKASLVIPILERDAFWGLLIAHTCKSTRHWLKDEIELLQHLASQVSIALNQAQSLEIIQSSLEKEQELNELKSRFFSMTSHDVRVPLSSILNAAELIEHYGHNFSREKTIRHVQKIQTAVKKIVNLLEDARTIIKDIGTNLTVNSQNVDIPKLCQNLVAEMENLASKKHSISFHATGNFTNTCLDEKLLGYIITNLLENAIKYSPEGGKILFEINNQDNVAVFRIQDEGIGIPDEDQELLFNYSKRGSNVGSITGTGIGLAIVKNCVDLHGGNITVNSKVGMGTTFTVTIPSQCQNN